MSWLFLINTITPVCLCATPMISLGNKLWINLLITVSLLIIFSSLPRMSGFCVWDSFRLVCSFSEEHNTHTHTLRAAPTFLLYQGVKWLIVLPVHPPPPSPPFLIYPHAAASVQPAEHVNRPFTVEPLNPGLIRKHRNCMRFQCKPSCLWDFQ